MRSFVFSYIRRVYNDLFTSAGDGPVPAMIARTRRHMLMLFPRSDMGFKYRFHPDDRVGIVNSNYYLPDNIGQIMIKAANNESTSFDVKRKMRSLKARSCRND